MRSRFSNGAAPVSKLELPCAQNNHWTQASQPQFVSNPPTYCVSAVGVLRYNRESDDNRINVPTILSELPPLADFAVKCQFCGEKASPLGRTRLQEPEILVKQSDLCEGRFDQITVKEEEDVNKFVEDIPIGFGEEAEVTINTGKEIQPVMETYAPESNILRFRLSCAPEKGNWTVCPGRAPEKCLATEREETQALVPCDHKPLKFGICHRQDGSERLLKNYSSGKKCLTLFRDGSAQVFYPSGQLALLVVIEDDGRVCLVYDDSTPNQVMRAVFRSDGRAACYHGNGNIWLSLNTLGGQCLDESGARIRRWSWNNGPLHPLFLSLNKAVGVRVLGRTQVFVSFLAEGQQAKFRVGSCCAQTKDKHKEDIVSELSGDDGIYSWPLLGTRRSRNMNAVAATPELKTPYFPNVRQIHHQSCTPPVNNPPIYLISTVGVLKYNRESNDKRTNLSDVLSKLPPLEELALKCEHCGEKAIPSLDLSWLQEPEAVQQFCCVQHQQLCEMLLRERELFEERCDLSTVKEEDDQFLKDMAIKLGAQSDDKINKGYSIQAAKESFAPRTNTFRFRHSTARGKRNWTMRSSKPPEKCWKPETEETQTLVHCDHKPLKFGICHRQDGSEFLLKYYSSGKKCLTLFRDGSAQVFYPSGQLALLVVIEDDGRVCLVYDDSTPNQVMRAVFRSDGRAACYHGNGNIWLSLNTLGGQCLDESGARIRRWSWNNGPLHPLFLSLNKAVGVRVLGRTQVFVSFLAEGQQAKFRVGSCCAQGGPKTDGSAPVPVAKDELSALAARGRTYQAIHKLQQHLLMHI